MKYKTKKTDNPLNARIKITLKETEKRKIQKKSSPRGHTESPILREALLLKILADREVVCILTILPVPVFPF